MKQAPLEPFSYTLVPSPFGTLGVVWWEIETGPRVYRIFLPHQETSTADLVRAAFPGARPLTCPTVTDLSQRLQASLEGTAVELPVRLLALERTSPFQRRVLLAEAEIPRGWVSTYGRLAHRVGSPQAARVVGNALSRNPFPVFIPCHRTIRSDGHLGGYQGGQRMKRALLEYEGIEFSKSGKVITDQVFH